MSVDPEPVASPRAAAQLFQPVTSERISKAIFEQVRGLIRTGELPIGARLPPERKLCDQFGVSRMTVRDALRLLEANGLVQVRVGARGGAFVTAPTAGQVGAGITDLLSMSALSAADVTQARELFELGIVALVCERATERDLDDLVALCDEAEQAREQGHYTVDMSFDFHLRVAAASHNPAIALLLNSFREPVIRSLQEAHHEGKQGVSEHRSLVAALRARDVARAQQVLSHHLERTAKAVAGR